MDLWTWVYDLVDELYSDGEDHLADLITQLPSMALDGLHEQVAAAVPQLVGAAKARGVPWLAVFARHWELQSRAGKLGQGTAVLTTAIEALDLAHSEEARGCPQAVCTVQDLCIAYANVDDRGFAAERLGVTTEIFSQIDKTWPCFTCISVEHASALIDSGLPQEALDFLARQQPLIARDDYPDDRFAGERVRAAVALDRPEEALRAVEAAERHPATTFGEVRKVERRLERAQALAALGDVGAAREALPGPAELEPRARADWVQVATALAAAGLLDNDTRLGEQLRGWTRERIEAGAYSAALAIATAGVELAVQRGARWAAFDALGAAREAAQGLRDPQRVAATLQRLAETAESAAPPVLLPDASAADLPSDGHAEEEIDVWLEAAERWPDDEEVVLGTAGRLTHLGDTGVARQLISAFLEVHPDAQDAPFLLVEIALRHEPQAREEIARELERHTPEAAEWLRARWAYREARFDDCIAMCEALVRRRPDAQRARRLWARAAGENGDYEQMLDLIEQVLDLVGLESEEADEDHWWRMVAATAAGRWEAVRSSGRHLGLQFDTDEGPVDEEWHTVVVRYDDGTDELALRTGPVSARVLSVAAPGQPQRADDVLVYDPTLESPPPDEPDDDWIPVHRHLVTLERGDCLVYPVVGVGDDVDLLRRAMDAIDEAGARLWIATSKAVWSDPDDEEVPGFAARVAQPQGADAARSHQALSEVFGRLPDANRPVLWPQLAAAAEDQEAAAAHSEQWDRWRF